MARGFEFIGWMVGWIVTRDRDRDGNIAVKCMHGAKRKRAEYYTPLKTSSAPDPSVLSLRYFMHTLR